ncbi:MAG: DUF1449 family protein [Verrucomicrobia bacterium]|nr:DUF1449 family protein [Verrucomicrobiota bacterium]
MSLDFLSEAGFLPFAVALALLLLIALLELIGLIIGHGLSHLADSWLPDLHLGDGLHGLSGFDKVLAWLYVGKFPAVALLAVFLASFGLGGVILQEGFRAWLGHPVSAWLAAAIMAGPALYLVHTVGRIGGRMVSRSESLAVSADSLVGRRATIALGTARRGRPAQAKVRDEHGKMHYVMLEPSSDETAFVQGTEVTLVERRGSTYTAV